MLNVLRSRLNKDEEDGFTLIELMVVVLIIAILIAIAIPTFLGAQDRARDRGAQSDLRNGITASKTIATDNAGEFTGVTIASLGAAEGSLTFAATGTTTDIGVVGGGTTTPTHVLLFKQSPSNKWYGVVATKSGTVRYCTGAAATNVNSVTVSSAGAITAGCNAAKW
ncbi:hypothetical protein BH18ACT1_BH18ACT1_17550 [soil metagenome]